MYHYSNTVIGYILYITEGGISDRRPWRCFCSIRHWQLL